MDAETTLLTNGVDFVVVWGHDEEHVTMQHCATWAEAHALAMAKKAEGYEVAVALEQPIATIGEDVDPVPPVTADQAAALYMGHYIRNGKWMIGFWRSRDCGDLPHPSEHVDERQTPERRQQIAAALMRGETLASYRGLSNCRICDAFAGSRDLGVGPWVYPEGLAHYVLEHGVLLPEAMLADLGVTAIEGPAEAAPEAEPLVIPAPFLRQFYEALDALSERMEGRDLGLRFDTSTGAMRVTVIANGPEPWPWRASEPVVSYELRSVDDVHEAITDIHRRAMTEQDREDLERTKAALHGKGYTIR